MSSWSKNKNKKTRQVRPFRLCGSLNEWNMNKVTDSPCTVIKAWTPLAIYRVSQYLISIILLFDFRKKRHDQKIVCEFFSLFPSLLKSNQAIRNGRANKFYCFHIFCFTRCAAQNECMNCNLSNRKQKPKQKGNMQHSCSIFIEQKCSWICVQLTIIWNELSGSDRWFLIEIYFCITMQSLYRQIYVHDVGLHVIAYCSR